MRMSLYGHVALKKDFCQSCKCDAFIVDGRYACCDSQHSNDSRITKVKRESEGLSKALRVEFKNKILALQHHKCIFCGVHLAETLYYRHRNKFRPIRTEFDHFIPRAFCPNNETNNIFASCNVCNRIKTSKMFDSLGDAREHIIAQRRKNGTLGTFTLHEISVLTSASAAPKGDSC